MELLQIKFCTFEYSSEATILQVETFQKQIQETNCRLSNLLLPLVVKF